MASLTKVKLNNIDTSVTFVYDPLVLLNYGSTLANTDVGFVFNRDGGVSSNVALYWNESTDRVTVAYTTASGLPNSNISIAKYANVAADWYFGNLAGGTTNTVWVSANVLPTANAFYNFGSPTQRWNVGYFAATTLDLGGSQISVDPTNGFKFTVGGTGTPIYLASNGAINGTTLSSATTLTVGTSASVGTNLTLGGFINSAGNVLATGGVFNSLTVNGNETITGFLNVSGNILSTGAVHNSLTVNGPTNTTNYINTTANVLAAGGIFNALTVNGNHNATGYINTTANVSAAVGVFGAINSTGLINTSANILASTFSGGQIYVSGLVNAGGNVLASTGIFNYLNVNGNIDIGSIAIPGVAHNIVGNVTQSGAGTIYYNTPGNIMASVGRFGSVLSDGLINTSANVLAATGRFGSVLSDGFINTSANVSAATYIGGSVNVSGLINTAGNILTKEIAVFGNAQIGSLSTAGVVHDIIGNIRQTGAGTIFFNTAGNIMAAVGRFGSISTDGFINTSANVSTAQLNAGQINTTGNVLATAGTFNALTVNGNESITGFLNVTGNILSAGAILNALTVNGNESITGYLNVTGNVIAATGVFGSINSTGFINTSGNISASTVRAAQINTTGNVLATGGVFNALTVNGNESVTGFLNVTGNLIALTADVGGIEATGIVYANSSAITTSSTSGAVRVAGGMGVGGNTVIAGILTVGSTSGVDVSNFTDTAGAFYGTANSWVQLGLQNASTAIGASTDFIAYANNGDNNTGWIDMGITGQNYINQNGAFGITGPNDGYIFMSGVSGAGTGGNLVIATGNTGVYNDVIIATGGFDTIHEQARFIDGVGLKLIQGTASTNTSTGALIVQGGVGIGGNLNVQGDISLNGNLFLTGNAITFDTNNLSIADSLIYLATENSGDIIDIGFIGHFINPGYQHTGFVRDASDGTWKLFANVVAEPTTTVDFTNATYSNLKIGNLSAVSAGFDSNVTAAYLIGTLGTAAQPAITSVGILTSVTASGLINTSGNILASAATFNELTVNGNETVTGYLNVTGNVLTRIITANTISVNMATANAVTAVFTHGSDVNFQLTSQNGVGLNTSGTEVARFGMNYSGTGWDSFTQYVRGSAAQNGYMSLWAANSPIANITSSGLTVNGNESVTGYLNVTGNILGASGTLGALTVNGGITSTGFINTSGNISGATVLASTLRAAVVNSTGNVLATGGIFNALTVNGDITSTGFINTSGNVSASRINGGGATISGELYTGEIFVSTIGGDEGGQLNIGRAVTNTTLAGNVVIDVYQNKLRIFEGGGTARGGYFDISGLAAGVGTNLAAGGGGGTPGGGPNQIQFNQSSTFAGAASLYYYGANGAVVSNAGISSTSTTSGSFQITGGVGITENINAGGSITAAGAINTAGNLIASQVSAGSVITTGVINAGGNLLAKVGIFNELDVNGNIAVGLISTPGAGHSIVGNVTQSGAGTVYFNTPGNIMASNVAAGTVTADIVNSTNNGNGTNFKVGDDAWIGDINIANTLGIKGQQDGTQGYVRFGNVNTNALGVNGSGPLSWGGALNITGNLLAGATTLGATTVNGTALTVSGYINSTGNILSTGAVHNSLTVNGATTQAGTLTVSSGFINSAGNILATGGVFNALTVNGVITSTQATGTAPFTVASTTLVTNLNADLWDGNHFATYLNQAVLTSSTPTFAGVNLTGNILATGGILNSLTINGTTNTQTVQPLASNTYTLGTTTAWYTKTFTKAAIAQYADLAENYTSDKNYVPGTVVVFGGDKEVTISTTTHDPAIAGVVSTNPAYHMNALTEGVAVALQGRVPTRVKGPVSKGDRVVSSNLPGVAIRLDKTLYEPGCIIGKALEDILDDRVHTIEVVVGRV